MSDMDFLRIALPRADWLAVERALMTAHVLSQDHPNAALWLDLLGIIGRARDAATLEHEAAIRAGKLVRDRERQRRLRKATPQP